MANGIATELRAHGYDPRSFTLLAYGGNGPLHGCGIANQLGIDRILVPPFCSVFSAVGAGNMHQLHIHERSLFMWIYDSNTRHLYNDYAAFNTMVEALEEAGRQDLLRQGMRREDIRHRLELDLRYGNQLAQTTVVAPKLRLERMDDVIAIISQFSVDYGNRFGKGSEAPEAGIRINTIRVQSYVELETVNLSNISPSGAGKAAPAPTGTRQCWFVGHDQALDTSTYDHAALEAGTVVHGPAVIVSATTTYLVEPGWRVEIGEHGAAWFLRGSAETPQLGRNAGAANQHVSMA
jgi:N-methylhydantoinase A